MDLHEIPGALYCEFKKGDYIIRQGEKIDFLYYLISGSCYRSSITENGDEIIYGLKKSKDFIKSIVGVMFLYSDGFSQNHFVARSDCCCYKIPKEAFLNYVQDKPELLGQLLKMSMDEYQNLANSFLSRQEGKTANRLCGLLLENAQNKKGRLIVSKEYNNKKISSFLGVHRVTVAKILKSLKEEGVIGKEIDGINIVDEKKLAIYANAKETLNY